jgi:hypothetical protein
MFTVDYEIQQHINIQLSWEAMKCGLVNGTNVSGQRTASIFRMYQSKAART